MSWDGINNAIYALSNINALGQSFLNYRDNLKSGTSYADATLGLGFSIMNAGARNLASREIADSTGSYLGYAVNNTAGYGTPEADAKGTAGTIAAAQLSSPWGLFSMMPSVSYMPMPYMGRPMMGGFFGGIPGSGWFSNGCCHTMSHSFFSPFGGWRC